MSENSRKPLAFVVQNDELAAMIAVHMKLKCNPLSRYAGTRPEDETPLSEDTLNFMQNERFKEALCIIAQPQLRLSAMKGGGAFCLEPLTVYGRTTPGGIDIVAVLFGGGNTILALFDSIDTFADWWSEMFAARINSAAPLANFLHGRLKIGELVLMLHLIDSYKRAHMESMLLYSPNKDYMVEAEEFFTSLRVAIRSGDIRWLLPAFFALTPGLAGMNLDIQPGMLEIARKLEFIGMLEQVDNAQLKFIYLNTGAIMGNEFANTWMYGVGWNASILNNGTVTDLSYKFLAPTSLANHLFTVYKESDNSYAFSHESYTFDEFTEHFRKWMKEMAATIIPSIPMKGYCKNCGASLSPGARFCSKCGITALPT